MPPTMDAFLTATAWSLSRRWRARIVLGVDNVVFHRDPHRAACPRDNRGFARRLGLTLALASDRVALHD